MHYWSCSDFADKLRGAKKPLLAGSDEWEEWHAETKKAHPIRYYLAETGLDAIQDFVNFIPNKIKDLGWYITCRFYTKTHTLTASKEHIKPGEYADLPERIMFCLFDELVNFVECELANDHYRSLDDKEKALYKRPWVYNNRYTRRYVKDWRSKELGIKSLVYRSTHINDQHNGYNPTHNEFLKISRESVDALEILDLYFWWTVTYKNRIDPYTHDKEELLQLYGKSENVLFSDRIELEDRYDKEVQEKLHKLIDKRQTLWT